MRSIEESQTDELQSVLQRHVLHMAQDEGRAVARVFYAELFSRAPRIRLHFAGLDVDDRAEKLWSVLRLVVPKYNAPARIREALTRVARTHTLRGVESSDYGVFADTLADVLAHSQRAVSADEARHLWLRELARVTAMISTHHR